MFRPQTNDLSGMIPRCSPRQGLTFCDLSTFYCARGGGITTYHRAKLDWFARQSRHRYLLVVPGPRFRVTRPAGPVAIVETHGPPIGRHRDGYRLMINYRQVRNTVASLQPDLVEVSDPWVSGPFALLLRRRGHFGGVLTSFYHTDPISAYAQPWERRTRLPSRLAGAVVRRSSALFWRTQAAYDCTVVASECMRRLVQAQGISRVLLAGFGVDPQLLASPPPPATAGRPARLLFVGRLQPEKGIDLVLRLIPHLVDPPAVTLTVVGGGPYAERLAALGRTGVRVEGHVASRDRLRDLYRAHDILLAPGPAETFGLSALKGMACGLVLVGADSGGIGHLQREARSPFGFAAHDFEGFVEATRRAVEADRTEVSRRGRQLAERHGSWSDAVGRQVALYESVIAEHRNDGCAS